MESTIPIESALASVMDASNEAMVIINSHNGEFVAINDAQQRIFGFSLQQLNNITLGKYYNISNTKFTLKQFLSAKRFEVFFCDILSNNDRLIPVEINTTRLLLGDKDLLLLNHKENFTSKSSHSPSSFLSIERAFKDTEAKWESLTENSPDLIILVDLSGTILFFNHALSNLTIDDSIGKSYFTLFGQEHAQTLKTCHRRVIETGKSDQVEISYTPAGSNEAIYLDNRISAIYRDGNIIALSIFCRDISILRRTLQQLEQSQRQLTLSLNAGRTGVWYWDINTDKVSWSEGVESLFGMEPGSFQGTYEAFRKLIYPDDIAVIESAINRTMQNNTPYYVEFRLIFPDGTLHWQVAQGEMLTDNNRKPFRLIGTVTDITQRKLIEETLEQQKYLLDKSQEIAHIGSYHWDVTTNQFTWSDEMFRIFGIRPENFTGDGLELIEKVIHPDDREKLINSQIRILQEKKPSPLEYRIVWPDNTIRYVWGEGTIILDSEGNVSKMIGTVQDITERKRAESVLHKTQQKLFLHFKQSLMGIIEWNTEFEVIEWNPAAEKIFGYTKEEAFGKNALKLIVPEAANAHVDKIWLDLMSNTGGRSSINENVTKKGTVITCEWNNTPLINDHGKIIGVTSLVNDITERVMAQKELEKHRMNLEKLVAERTAEIREQARILNQIHDSVVTVDINGIITSWNNGAERLHGFTASEIVGHHISELFPLDQQEFLIKEVMEPYRTKGVDEADVTLLRKSGDTFHAHLSLTNQLDDKGNVIGIIGCAFDITARKRAEQQLFAQQAALENANRELESFSYTVSHDLRAPLRSIDGFSNALIDEYYSKLDDTAKNYLDRIRKNANKMASLIDDLLQLSRITRHKLNLECFDIGSLAMDIVQKYKYENINRKIEFDSDPDMIVEGDPNLVRIALNNLIDNACKYSSVREVTKITFKQMNDGNGKIFCVADNGVGFDMRYSDKLFNPFQRLHNPEEFAGNGIGLATVARIIRRHGGRVWAESKLGKGANFYFTIDTG